MRESSFSSFRRRYTTTSASADFEYFTVFDAPYLLSHDAIVECLKLFCQVISKRRNRIQGCPEVGNGICTYRVRFLKCVPCYLRFGKFQLRFQHAGQFKTCCRCGLESHIARDCSNEECFNCDAVGHVACNCPEDMRCCICKSTSHRAIDCPFSWCPRPATYCDAHAPAADPAAQPDDPAASEPNNNADPEDGSDSLAGVRCCLMYFNAV